MRNIRHAVTTLLLTGALLLLPAVAAATPVPVQAEDQAQAAGWTTLALDALHDTVGWLAGLAGFGDISGANPAPTAAPAASTAGGTDGTAGSGDDEPCIGICEQAGVISDPNG